MSRYPLIPAAKVAEVRALLKLAKSYSWIATQTGVSKSKVASIATEQWGLGRGRGRALGAPSKPRTFT